jgi:hypothetical protein
MTTLESRYQQIVEVLQQKEQVEALQKQLSNPHLDQSSRHKYENELHILQKKISSCDGGGEGDDANRNGGPDLQHSNVIEYILDSLPFIAEYASSSSSSSVSKSSNNIDMNTSSLTTTKTTNAEKNTKSSSMMDGFVEITKTTNNNKIFNQYLLTIEKRRDIDPKTIFDTIDNESEYVCQTCNIGMCLVSSESILLCRGCGITKPFMELNSTNLNYEQETSRNGVNTFCYKRLNHFSEIVNSLQARENCEIPTHVLEAVREEYRKSRTTKRSEITPQKTRQFLKKLNLVKYYEHTHQITQSLSGISAPKLSPQLESKLRQMFVAIQTPFSRHAPPHRKNFLSYNYVIHKCLELLGKDEFLIYFPLLKSRIKLHECDSIWKKICQDLQWQYVSSV